MFRAHDTCDCWVIITQETLAGQGIFVSPMCLQEISEHVRGLMIGGFSAGSSFTGVQWISTENSEASILRENNLAKPFLADVFGLVLFHCLT